VTGSRRTVLLTGAAGFLGSHVADALLRRGDAVRGLDNFDPFYDPAIKRRNLDEVRAAGGEFEFHEGDVRDAAAVDRALRGCDAVVHLAAKAGVRPSALDPVGYADVNVRGTAVVLDAAERAGIRRIVLASSSSVYGSRSDPPFREDGPVDRPASVYAATKRAMEVLARAHADRTGAALTCLRFFTAYGPRQRPEMAIHSFARRILDGKAVVVYGDGSARRDFTYVDDIVDGVVRALDRASGWGIYNLGESEVHSVAETIALLEEILGRKAILEHRPPDPGDVPLTCADVSRARASLGYEPRVPLREGLRRFARWLTAGSAAGPSSG
jgi:UDP-glucuronate 4-epimerase